MSLSVPEILDQLELNRGFFPREAVEAAIARREEMVPELLRILDQAAEQPERLATQEATFNHIYALYLLAQFREPEAYPRVIRFFSLPGEVSVEATGDVVTQDLDRILASLSHGDVRPIQQLIEDPQINEWVRGAAVNALQVMVFSDQLSREEVVAYLGELLDGKLERVPSNVWNSVASVATDLHPGELAPMIRRAYEEELIESFFMTPQEFEQALAEPRQRVLEQSRRRNKGLIGDTVAELSWWACFNERRPKRSVRKPERGTFRPVRTAEPKVGRNAPCPCGSGKKYKKCCGSRASA